MRQPSQGRCLSYYDGKNRQIARSLNDEVRFNVWDGWELVEEWANSATRSAAYLQGMTGVIKSLTNNVYYYQDKLGSTTHIANASGALLEGYRYDLYGAPNYYEANGQPKATQASGHGIVDLYAGERWIPNLGLYDLRNRFLSSELGRFLQADPIGFKGDASNLYRYCHNDPVNKTDPMGLYTTSALTSFGGGDWRWFNGGEVLTQLQAQQEQQSAGNDGGGGARGSGGAMNMAYTVIIPGYGPGQKKSSDSKWSNQQFIENAKATDPNNYGVFGRNQKSEMMKAIADARARGDYTLNIFGYSRGAVAAVQLAQRLGRMGIGVDRFVTIDPVRVRGFGDGPGSFNVPGNVRQAANYYQQGNRSGFWDLPGTPLTGNVQNYPLGGAAPLSGRNITHQRMPSVVAEIDGYEN